MDIVALLEVLVNGLLKAEEEFYKNPGEFYDLETAVRSSTDALARDFLTLVLNGMNQQIYDDIWRKAKYNAQRNDQRTLIT